MDLGVIKRKRNQQWQQACFAPEWPEGIVGEITGLGAIRVEKRRRQWQPTPVLLPGKSHGRRSLVGCSPRGRKESDTTERFHFHALEKEMATHSSVLAWETPWTEEPGRLWSIGLQRIRCDWVRTHPLTNTVPTEIKIYNMPNNDRSLLSFCSHIVPVNTETDTFSKVVLIILPFIYHYLAS